MSLHDMPFLILNLGVEMVFVLNSRLHAQSVPSEQAASVLGDVGTNIFDPVFVDELFTPHPMYSSASVLQVFTALSNSSVMRLSENSMRKLYDLVYMTVKYQVFTLRHPLELLELTLNHLDAAQAILPAGVRQLASAAEERVLRLASTLNVGDWASMRRSLLNFFTGRHARVSVLLDSKVQDVESGAFYIPRDTFLSPLPACKPPGLVYVAGFPQPGTFAHPDAHLPYPPHVPLGSWSPKRGAARMTNNGFDIYAAAAASFTPATAAGVASTAMNDPLTRQTREMPIPKRSASDGTSAVTAFPSPATPPSSSLITEERQSAYDAEVNYLAQLIGSTSRAHSAQEVELELFHDGAGSAGETAAATSVPFVAPKSTSNVTSSGGGAAVAPAVPVTRMTVSLVKDQNKKLLGIMSDFNFPKREDSGVAGGTAPATGGNTMNDLLDIMDEV
ncbi:Organic solute transport protein 1 [Leishmania braziliensis]|nr:Organic solute transport protein 1 [Leishmania braziliensis]